MDSMRLSHLLANRLAPLFLLGALSVAPALAQEEEYKSDASVEFFGTFGTHNIPNVMGQTATLTGGVLGSYRYFLDDNNGFEVNYGWAPGSEKYANFPATTEIGVNSDEFTAAYVARLPGPRWSPFGLIGAGAVVFDPQVSPLSMQARGALLWGGGVDFNATHRYFLRAEYRGLFFSSPDFNQAILHLDKTWDVRNEVTLGFGVRF